MYKPLQYMRENAQYNRAGEKAPVGVRVGAGLEALTVLAAGGLAAIVGGSGTARADSLIGPSQAHAATQSGHVSKKVPGLDYEFDGGVYVWGAPGFPKERWNASTAGGRFLSQKDKDILPLFKDQVLYSAIGKNVEGAYQEGKLLRVCFADKFTGNVALSFKINGQYIVAFQSVDQDVFNRLNQYDKE